MIIFRNQERRPYDYTVNFIPLLERSLKYALFMPSTLQLSGLPAQAKKHAESAKTTLLTWKGSTTSDKEKKEILEALVMLYYTLGVSWLLQNQYPLSS